MKASIKRKLIKGTSLTMISYKYRGNSEETNKTNKPREIMHTQTNAVRFEGGSWLHFGDWKASESELTKNGFILNDGVVEIEYIFNNNI